MTLQELYQSIGADYTQATRVLRMDKLIDKHIRKLAKNDIFERLIAAGATLDPTAMFESAHAVKGVCANLGLTRLSESASELSEEFRPGSVRTMSDAQVAEKIAAFQVLYRQTVDGINRYAEG